MPLSHRSVLANRVRAPKVVRGEVVMVGRYKESDPKVALVHPEDFAMLEHDHLLISQLREISTVPIDELTVKAQQLEDEPEQASITDPAKIAEILGL